jgi:splicing factor U2AF subunit
MNVGAMSILAGTNSGDLEKGRVLELMNMVTIEELMDGEEYDGMCSFPTSSSTKH